MKLLLILVAGVAYLLALLCLTVIVFLPAGVGFWINSGEISYTVWISDYFRAVCFILLITFLGGGFYLLWRKLPRLA